MNADMESARQTERPAVSMALPPKRSRPDIPLVFAAMQCDDIDEVVDIELAAYPFPWRRENFVDSLRSGYQAWTVRDQQQRLLGYFLMMAAVDEAHLLNITVAVDYQGQGTGLRLLDQSVALAHSLGMTSVLLEVRPSNERALAIYRRYGFAQIGLRKNYYPAVSQQREDALVMRLPL